MRSLLLILLSCFLISGCALTRSTRSCYPISVPKRPKTVNFESRKESGKQYNNTKWVKDPVIIDPDPKGKGLMWRAFPEGAIAFSYKDLEALDYMAEAWPLYADAMEKLIKEHNKDLDGGDKKSSWKWLWWRDDD